MEKRKVAKALPFACHFSLTGTVRFFCCFFDKKDHPLGSHQSLNIWINFSQFLRGSSPNENRGSWPQPPVLARTPSSVVVWFLNSRKRVIWLESHFWHMLEKRKHYESRSGRHIYSTPPCWANLYQIEDIIHYLFRKMKWERGTSWEKLWALRNKLCSRTNIQAFS